jgi:hypothetical protein
MKKLAVATGVVIAVVWAVPAAGGPSLVVLDKREKQHYKSLDRRIKAATLLTVNQHVVTTVESAALTQSSSGLTFSGSVGCGAGETLTGGGVDWSVSSTYGDYRVIDRAPNLSGTQWTASVGIGAAPTPTTFPRVYAVCASV